MYTNICKNADFWQILGRRASTENVMWPRDRWSDFRKLGIKRCVRLERKNSWKGVSRSAAVARQSPILYRGVNLTPPPLWPSFKIGLKVSILDKLDLFVIAATMATIQLHSCFKGSRLILMMFNYFLNISSFVYCIHFESIIWLLWRASTVIQICHQQITACVYHKHRHKYTQIITYKVANLQYYNIMQYKQIRKS